MAIGMSYDQFWNGDYEAAKMYREAYKLKADEDNYKAWLHGRYIYEAIGAWVPLQRAFSKAKKPGDYPKEPYGISHKHMTEEEIEDAKHKKEDGQFLAFMAEWTNAVNKKFEAKGAEKVEQCSDSGN